MPDYTLAPSPEEWNNSVSAEYRRPRGSCPDIRPRNFPVPRQRKWVELMRQAVRMMQEERQTKPEAEEVALRTIREDSV